MRLTQYAQGGGCACKIPPGELEDVLAGLGVPAGGEYGGELLVGLEAGDDAAVVRIENGTAVVATADFFTPVVDDPYDWGRIAAANALSDVYAMGGRPLIGVNLLSWPRDVLPYEVARQVLSGGAAVAAEAGCHLAGGHTVNDPEPKYGLAVTGIADPDRLLRNDRGTAGLPLTLTKPLGLGVLNNRHKATGEVFKEAVAVMTRLNAEASRAAGVRGVGGDRHGGGAVPGRSPRGGARRLRARRDPAQPRLGRPAHRRRPGRRGDAAAARRRADLRRAAARGGGAGRARDRRARAARGEDPHPALAGRAAGRGYRAAPGCFTVDANEGSTSQAPNPGQYGPVAGPRAAARV